MRNLLAILNSSFAATESRSSELLELVPEDYLFRRPRDLPETFAMFSVGEYILRSAAAVEQVFNGITTRMWDDPFEWTLPEKLSTVALVREYLKDVETIRIAGFAYFSDDNELRQEIPSPRDAKPIAQILIESLARAEHFQGRAYAVFQMLSDSKLPRI